MKKWLLLFLLTGTSVLSAENLLLAHTDAQGVPEGRKVPAGTTVTAAGDKLDITFKAPGSLQYTVYITPDLGSRLHLTGTLQATDLAPGDADWKNGRIAMRFLDATGKQTGGWPPVVSTSGTVPEKPFSRIYSIPPGATTLLIEPAHFGRSGEVAFRNLTLETTPDNLLLAPNPNGVPTTGITAQNFQAAVADGAVNFTIDGTGSRQFNIPLSPTWKSLKLTMKMKLTNVRRGDADWKDARIAMRFYSPKGPVGEWPQIFRGSGTSETECSRVYPIPEGATTLQIEPANFGPEGKAEFLTLHLTPFETK